MDTKCRGRAFWNLELALTGNARAFVAVCGVSIVVIGMSGGMPEGNLLCIRAPVVMGTARRLFGIIILIRHFHRRAVAGGKTIVTAVGHSNTNESAKDKEG